jgi:hypothetical protein
MTDHFSGPRAVAEPQIDFTDLFCFPSPSQPGRLGLAMDVHPAARAGSVFSDGAIYRFRIRPATILASGPGPLVDAGSDEYAISFIFAEPGPPDRSGLSAQEGTCMLPDGATVFFRVNDEHGGHGKGARVFAGLRLDPFFEAAPRQEGTRMSRRTAVATVADPRDQQYLSEYGSEGFFILSIVAEIDVETVLGPAPGPLFAVAVETITAGKLPIRLERYGRPLVKNVLLSRAGPDSVTPGLELRPLYNLEDPFHLAPDYLDAYRARLTANLAYLDGLDSETDWPLRPDGIHPLTGLFLGDHQVVDVSKPFAEDSYLEIEWALAQGRAHTTCGGRWLTNDAFDSLYTLLVTSPDGPLVSDGADPQAVRSSHDFPFLAPPGPPP